MSSFGQVLNLNGSSATRSRLTHVQKKMLTQEFARR
jgi:hypothetical protein